MPDLFVSNPGQDSKKAEVENDKPVLPSKIPSTETKLSKIEGHTHNKFSAFAMYPEDVDFETREDDEKIILLLRAHPITNLKWILITLLMIFVPMVIRSYGFFNSLPGGFDLVIGLAWYLITMAYALEKFLDWYFNVYIVTTLRVVDVDFFNLIYKQVSDANLNKIQDVTYNMGGVARTVFNYGDVFIQTAAEVSEFKFEAVPDPARVAKVIEDLITKEEK